jgi:hypothetical protein
MATVLPALSLLFVHAAQLSTSSVPAAGRQEALLTLDAPQAIHISARSGPGTWCEIIDRVRGPFAQAGATGGTNCELDLLLDAGQYKLRFESPRKGKGQVAISATPFTELNNPIPRIVPGNGTVTTLKPRQQATYWLSLKERGVPWVRIAGRHAGEVRLLKNGEWLEPARPYRTQFSPKPGQPMHEWWLDSPIEAGEYKLVVYGQDSTTVTGGSVDDSLTIEAGFRAGPAERQVAFNLPSSGVFAVMVPSQLLAGVMSLEKSPASSVELQVLRSNVRTPATSCRVEKNALVPECSTTFDGRAVMSIFMVRGPPGTRGTLEWAEYRYERTTLTYGGYYGPSAQSYDFRGAKGTHFVGLNDLPMDFDSAPLGCQLSLLKPNGDVASVVGRSVIGIGDGEKLEKDFNYDGSGAVVWFEIKSGGNVFQKVGLSSRRFRIKTEGGRKSTCEVYRVENAGSLKRLTQSKAEPQECNELLALDPGLYQLQLSSGLSGIEQLRITPDGDTSAKNIDGKGGCNLPSVQLEDANYRLTMNRTGAVLASTTTSPSSSTWPR